MDLTNEYKKTVKALVSKSSVAENGGFSKLEMIPLHNSEKYGTLFIGIESTEWYAKRGGYTNVWRIRKDGLECARLNENLDKLFFNKTPYKVCTEVEETTYPELFGAEYKKYMDTMEKYRNTSVHKRLQRYVSPHPQRDLLVSRLGTYKKEIASIALASSIAVGSIAGVTALASKLYENGVKQANQTQVEVVPTQAPESPIQINGHTIIDNQANATIEVKPTVETNTQPMQTQTEKYKDSFIKRVTEIKNSSSPGIKNTPEYRFFRMFSSTINENLVDSGEGEFATAEALLDAYYNNPERFERYGQDFLDKMNLQSMKLKLAKAYGISDFENVKITYEDKGGCYECRVRYGGKELETPAYLFHKSDATYGEVYNFYQGSRGSALYMQDWKDFLLNYDMRSIRSFGDAAQNSLRPSYNKKMETYLETMDKITETFSRATMKHQLTIEDEGR